MLHSPHHLWSLTVPFISGFKSIHSFVLRVHKVEVANAPYLGRMPEWNKSAPTLHCWCLLSRKQSVFIHKLSCSNEFRLPVTIPFEVCLSIICCHQIHIGSCQSQII